MKRAKPFILAYKSSVTVKKPRWTYHLDSNSSIVSVSHVLLFCRLSVGSHVTLTFDFGDGNNVSVLPSLTATAIEGRVSHRYTQGQIPSLIFLFNLFLLFIYVSFSLSFSYLYMSLSLSFSYDFLSLSLSLFYVSLSLSLSLFLSFIIIVRSY